MQRRKSTTRGFRHTAAVLSDQIRRAGESRGFAVARVLTHWDEIAGPEIAAVARPVKVSYGRGGLGATLTILTTGAQAPLLEMQRDRIRERVNAAYGYNAISRVRITQTAPAGFAEAQAAFAHAPAAAPAAAPDPAILQRAAQAADGVEDADLRAALERLGRNVLSKSKS